MTQYARWSHVGAAWLFVGGVIVQAFLAGAALTQLGGSGDFAAHIAFGEVVMGILGVAVLATAIAGRVPRGQLGLVLALVVDYVIQASLPRVAATAPFLAALHPANAMVLLLIGCVVGWRARRLAAVAQGSAARIPSRETPPAGADARQSG